MSKTQVNDYLSSVKAADRPNECEYCRKAFTPRVYAPRDPGYLVQRFCSKRCTDDMAHLNNQNALIEKGLLGVLDLSKRLDVSPYRVHQLITQGLLRAERVSFPGQRRPVWGASEEDVERFEREWARGEGSDTGYRRQWQTEDFALKQARSRNLRPELRELEPRDVEAGGAGTGEGTGHTPWPAAARP
jgi:MYM-type Zinc finger with FCS sequence motif